MKKKKKLKLKLEDDLHQKQSPTLNLSLKICSSKKAINLQQKIQKDLKSQWDSGRVKWPKQQKIITEKVGKSKPYHVYLIGYGEKFTWEYGWKP